MAPENPEALFRDYLRDMRRVFARQLPEQMEEIEALWQRLLDGPWNTEDVAALHFKTHRLRGSGAMHRFAQLSEAACPLDIALGIVVAGGKPPTQDEYAQISQGLAALRQAAVEARLGAGQEEA